MNNKKLIQSILVVVGAVVLVSGISLFIGGEQAQAPTQEAVHQEEISVTVHIEGLFEAQPVALPPDSTVLDALEAIDEHYEELQLQTETYEGMGTLVTSIGGIENGTNNEYWQYEVNDVMPMVAADAHEILDGDVITWEFKASEF